MTDCLNTKNATDFIIFEYFQIFKIWKYSAGYCSILNLNNPFHDLLPTHLGLQQIYTTL